MNQLLLATKNPGKIKELSRFLQGLPLDIVSLRDVSVIDDVEEDGKDYYENSKKKAQFYANLTGIPALSDDGGLEIMALDGAPGLFSRRWLGYEASDEELVEYLSKVAKELPDNNRTAYFRAVITLALPKGKVFQEFGEVKGIIAKKSSGDIDKGYPYRMFFYIPEIGKYYQDEVLSEEEVKKYHHRYKAMKKMRKNIKRIFNLKY